MARVYTDDTIDGSTIIRYLLWRIIAFCKSLACCCDYEDLLTCRHEGELTGPKASSGTIAFLWPHFSNNACRIRNTCGFMAWANTSRSHTCVKPQRGHKAADCGEDHIVAMSARVISTTITTDTDIVDITSALRRLTLCNTGIVVADIRACPEVVVRVNLSRGSW